MKKHMTIAALLAAGAAFSNAAVETQLLWGLDFTSTTLGLSTGTATSVTGSNTMINTTGGLFGTGSYSTDGSADNILKFTASGTTSALSKHTGAFTLSFHAKWDGDSTGGSKQWPVLASFGEGNGWCAKVDFAGANTGAQGIGSSGTYGINADGYNLGLNNRGGNVTLDNSWHHFVVTFQGSGDEDGTAKLELYVDGTSTVTVNWTGAGVDTNDSMTAFSFGGRLGNNNNNANMSFSDIAVYKGVLEADQIKYLGSHKANASAIPEPSAFGLLAGLGALALVASRRRRK